MYRASLQLWSNSHSKVYEITRYGNSKRFFSVKFNDVQMDLNYKNRLGTGFKMLHQPTRKYSSESGQSGGKSYKGIIALSTITLGTVGFLALVKSNPEIRDMMEKWIPGTDRTLKIIFLEENPYLDSISDFYKSVKESIFGADEDKSKESKRIETVQTKKEKITPEINLKSSPIFEPSTGNVKKVEKQSSEVKNVPSKPVTTTSSPQSRPTSLSELEARSHQIVTAAINSYNNTIKVIHDHNSHVIKILEENATSFNLSSSIWKKLKEAADNKKNVIAECERVATETLDSLKNLSNILSDYASDSSTKTIRESINKAMLDIDDARKKYEKERGSVKVTENFWNKVKTAQENFNEELEILFPTINIHDKRSPMNAEMLDLFVLYMYNKVNYLQTELEKLETIGNEKLKAAIMSSGKLDSEEKLNELIVREVQKEKRQLQHEFEKTLFAERKMLEENLRKQLKLQAEVNADQLKEALDLKEQESQRLIQRSLGEQLEKESNKYKSQIAVIVGRLRGLDEALKIRLNKEKGTSEAQLLWAACQALAKTLEIPNNVAHEHTVKPLKAEIKAVSNIAPKEDVLVRTTLAALPKEAVERGVYPETTLRARFLQVEHVARRLALIPEEGASLPMYLLSYLQNFLIKTASHSIPTRELADEPIDISKLDTYDILNRARYWLDRGDFKMALRYMNLLKGASRAIAKDWMNETKILLETKQAVDILMAYTGAISLLFLSGDEKQKVSN